MTHLVSDEHRTANLKAIRDRAAWRRRYRALTYAIRDAKARMVQAHRDNRFDSVSEIELLALRTLAQDMMMLRESIKVRLRMTAYTYADNPEKQAA